MICISPMEYHWNEWYSIGVCLWVLDDPHVQANWATYGNRKWDIFFETFLILSVVTRIETIYLKIRAHPLPKKKKRPLPVALRRSKTPLLKLPNITRRRSVRFLISGFSQIQWAITALPHVSVSKQVLVKRLSGGNEFDLHENKPVGRSHFPMNGFALRRVLIDR